MTAGMAVAFAATMLRLKARQRAALGETLRELANLVAGAFVLGQFAGERRPSVGLFLAGMTAWVAIVGLALVLEGGKDDA